MLHKHFTLFVIVGVAALLCGPSAAVAQTAPSLGAAQSFAVLGGSTVTNTGSTVITGDLGVSPGSAVTGFPPGLVVAGTIHAADALALSAQGSATTAYNALASQACTTDLTGQDLGGKTLTPGVYCFSTSAQLTGTLTLNALGNANAVFIFKIGSTLTTASGSSVLVINGGQICNVFWQVGSSATLGTTTSFAGNIIALTSITLTTGASVSGRTFARNGAVTLDTNTVSASSCPAVVPPGCPVITLTPPTLPNGTIGVAYSQTITASGGTAPYVFSLTAGALPAGLTLSATGVVSGTPTAAGPTAFTVRATDANGCFRDIAYTITVVSSATCPAITLSPSTLPNAVLGVAYSQTITGSGGTAPYTFTVQTGTLPAGLTLTAAGVLAGTPTTAGTSTFTIRGIDANGCFRELSYTVVIAVACPTITLAPNPLPNGTQGLVYSQQITASGGSGAVVFTLQSGALPGGLTLSSTGLVSGRPTGAGPSTFTVRGTDANGCFADVPYTMNIIASVPTLSEWALIAMTLLLGWAGFTAMRRRAL